MLSEVDHSSLALDQLFCEVVAAQQQPWPAQMQQTNFDVDLEVWQQLFAVAVPQLVLFTQGNYTAFRL